MQDVIKLVYITRYKRFSPKPHGNGKYVSKTSDKHKLCSTWRMGSGRGTGVEGSISCNYFKNSCLCHIRGFGQVILLSLAAVHHFCQVHSAPVWSTLPQKRFSTSTSEIHLHSRPLHKKSPELPFRIWQAERLHECRITVAPANF